jgi:hypothetical protein
MTMICRTLGRGACVSSIEQIRIDYNRMMPDTVVASLASDHIVSGGDALLRSTLC